MSAIVKFGAEDIGLEKTLKKVQTELSDLKDKVKGGDQSLSELEGTMKRIGELDRLEKRLNSMGDEASKASPKVDELGDDAKTMGNKAEDAGQKGETGIGKIGIAAGVAGAAFAAGMKVLEVAADAARAVVDSFGEALDLGGELNDLSTRTGESAGQLLVLQQAFDNTGVGADKVGASINKLQKFMEDAANGGDKQNEVMNRLGISLADLQGKTPTQQMQIFAEKISGIQDPTERAATAMTIFGKSGGELLPLLTNFSGEVEAAKGQLGGMPGIMDRTADAFDAISDNLNVAKGKLTEFAAGLLEKAAPALESFSEMLTGVDAAGWGQKLGEVVSRLGDMLIGAFKSPQSAIDAIGLSLEVGAKTMGNLLMNGFIDAGKFLSQFFSSDMPSLLANQFSTSIKSSFNSGLQFFVDGMLKVVKSFDSDFGRSSSGIVNFFKDSFSNILKLLASDWIQVFTNPLAFVSGKITSALSDAFNGGGVTFKSALTDGVETSLGKLSSGLDESAIQYSRDFETGTQKIGAEWEKITGNIEFSSKDFFGAEPAAKRLTDKVKEIEKSGEAFRVEFENLRNQEILKGEEVQKVEDLQKSFKEMQGDIDPLQGVFSAVGGSANQFGAALGNLGNNLKKVNGVWGVTIKTDGVPKTEAEIKKLAADLNGLTNPTIVPIAIEVGGFQDLADLKNELKLFPDSKAIKLILEKTGLNLEQLREQINGVSEDKRIEIAINTIGESDLKRAQEIINAINDKKVEAAVKATGAESLDELESKLNGVADPRTAKLAMEITGKTTLDDAVKALEKFPGTRDARALLEVSGLESLTKVREMLSGMVDPKMVKVALETTGLPDLEALKKAIDLMQGDNKKVVLNADVKPAEAEIKKLESNLNGLGNAPVEVKLNANSSVQNIRQELSKEIDVGLSSSKGTDLLSQIKPVIDAIRSAVEKLESKLPQPALGY